MRLSVLSWNVCHVRGEAVPARRHQRMVQRLQRLAPDIACLQEVGPFVFRYFLDQLRDYRVLGEPRGAGLDAERVPVLVRRGLGDVAEVTTFWHSESPDRPSRGWDAHHPRCATAVVLDLAPGRLAVCSCHLDHRGREARIRSADQLAAWAQTRHRHGCRVVLAGDLNARPRSAVLARLIGPEGPLRDSRAAADAAADAEIEGAASTWVGAGGLLRGRIDHVLTDPDLAVRSHRTLADEVGRRPVSDHRPVVVECEWPARERSERC